MESGDLLVEGLGNRCHLLFELGVLSKLSLFGLVEVGEARFEALAEAYYLCIGLVLLCTEDGEVLALRVDTLFYGRHFPLEGLNLRELRVETLAQSSCLRVRLKLLLAEAGEGPVAGVDTLLDGRQVLFGLVLLYFERVKSFSRRSELLFEVVQPFVDLRDFGIDFLEPLLVGLLGRSDGLTGAQPVLRALLCGVIYLGDVDGGAFLVLAYLIDLYL